MTIELVWKRKCVCLAMLLIYLLLSALRLQVARLFDLFLSSHPLMPLYAGAVAMHSQRQKLLSSEDMPSLHSALVNLAITKALTPDQLAKQVRSQSNLFCVMCIDFEFKLEVNSSRSSAPLGRADQLLAIFLLTFRVGRGS
jgi:hypothetical protein